MFQVAVGKLGAVGSIAGTPPTFKGTRLFAEVGYPFMVIQDVTVSGNGVVAVARAGNISAEETYDMAVAGSDLRPTFRANTSSGAAFNGRNPGDNTRQGIHSFWDGRRDAGAHAPSRSNNTITGQGFDWCTVGDAAEATGERILVGAKDSGNSGKVSGDFYHVIITDTYDQDQMRRARDYFNGYSVNALHNGIL